MYTILSGHILVRLIKEKKSWVGGRYVNITWNMPAEDVAKGEEIVKGENIKSEFDD